ncbi:MAG TPA: hypothetical protein VJY62_17745, partial [Bacteroidia bacterium]|nr:hypothetical protein [Bacteroidia bacterium]
MPPLADPKKIIQFCLDILKDYCINKPTDVIIAEDESNKNRYFLQRGQPDIAIGTYGNKMPIVLLKSGYWIHFSLNFEGVAGQKNKFEIKNLSLQLFKSTNKKLLFRAEWENKESKENSNPQPHWHIHPDKEVILENEKINISSFNEFLKITEVSNGFEEEINNNLVTTAKIGNFHFAMASKWHLDSNDFSII